MTKEYDILKKIVLKGTKRAIDKLIAQKEKAGEKPVVSNNSRRNRKNISQ